MGRGSGQVHPRQEVANGRGHGLIPTSRIAGPEYQRWSAVFAGDDYYYGSEPGPVARRAVRYHRRYRPRGGTALDAGCGEGQDLAFLAEQGYVATGVEFTNRVRRRPRGCWLPRAGSRNRVR